MDIFEVAQLTAERGNPLTEKKAGEMVDFFITEHAIVGESDAEAAPREGRSAGGAAGRHRRFEDEEEDAESASTEHAAHDAREEAVHPSQFLALWLTADDVTNRSIPMNHPQISERTTSLCGLCRLDLCGCTPLRGHSRGLCRLDAPKALAGPRSAGATARRLSARCRSSRPPTAEPADGRASRRHRSW